MELYQYKYSIRNVIFTIDGKSYNVQDGAVNYLFIFHDYHNRRMPVIKMHIELDSNMIGLIYKHKDTAIVKFDMYEQAYRAEQIVSTQLYMQHTFSIVMAKAQSEYITSSDITTERSVDDMRKLQLFEMYLVDLTAVNWFTKQLCGIYNKSSKAAVLHALFQQRDVPNNTLIMTPPLDDIQTDNIVLSLGDLIGNINMLNRRYGLYDTMPVVYYDMRYLYCINKYKPNIVLPGAEDFGAITVTIANPSSAERKVTGSFNDIASKTHFMNLTTEPTVFDDNDKATSAKFSTILTVDSSGKVDKATLNDNSAAMHYMYTYGSNELGINQMINENINGHRIKLHFLDCATAFIRPYKAVTFDVDTQYMDLGLTGHEYRVSNWALSLTREGTGTSAVYQHDIQMELVTPRQ